MTNKEKDELILVAGNIAWSILLGSIFSIWQQNDYAGIFMALAIFTYLMNTMEW